MTDWAGVLKTAIPVGGLIFFFWPVRKYIDNPSLHQWVSKFRGRAAVKTPVGEAAIEIAEQQASSKNPADATLPAALAESVPTSTAAIDGAAVLPPAPRIGVQILEHELREQIDALDPNIKLAVSIRALAEARLRAGHEFVYNRIFGSQIIALKALNQRGPISEAEARKEFEPLKVQFPEIYEKYPFEGWAGWLQRMDLVTFQNGSYEITQLGKDFLIYLAETGLMENKPL